MTNNNKRIVCHGITKEKPYHLKNYGGDFIGKSLFLVPCGQISQYSRRSKKSKINLVPPPLNSSDQTNVTNYLFWEDKSMILRLVFNLGLESTDWFS